MRPSPPPRVTRQADAGRCRQVDHVLWFGECCAMGVVGYDDRTSTENIIGPVFPPCPRWVSGSNEPLSITIRPCCGSLRRHLRRGNPAFVPSVECREFLFVGVDPRAFDPPLVVVERDVVVRLSLCENTSNLRFRNIEEGSGSLLLTTLADFVDEGLSTTVPRRRWTQP